MHPLIRKRFFKNIKQLQYKYQKDLQVGLGTIATGILGNEPILSPQKLARDLKEMQELNINEVVIFRLGGLNKKYLQTIKKFLRKK